MAKAKLADIVAHCNRTLKPDSFEDWPGAVNGLQVENRGSVSRIAAAVDATPATVKKAADEGADLLIVHHGLFWGKTHPWTGNRYKRRRQLLDNNIAVYSSHLPLDAHPRLGNNTGFAGRLASVRPSRFSSNAARRLVCAASWTSPEPAWPIAWPRPLAANRPCCRAVRRAAKRSALSPGALGRK